MRFVYDGKEYSSLNKVCTELGLNYTTVVQKAKKEKWTKERALDYFSKEHKIIRRQPIEYKGKKYRNLSTLVKELGISMCSLYMWAKRHGYHNHDANTIKKYLEHLKNKGYFYDGKHFNNQMELVEYLGVTPIKSFLKFLKQEKDINKAIEVFNNTERKNRYSFEFNGKKYSSLRKLCKEYGVTYKNVTNFALRYNLDRFEVFKAYLERKGNVSYKQFFQQRKRFKLEE